MGDGYDPCWGVRSSFFSPPLQWVRLLQGVRFFCGFFVICRGHLSGEGRYVSEYYKYHRYDIKYSMMKSLPVVGIFIKEIMIFGNISNVLYGVLSSPGGTFFLLLKLGCSGYGYFRQVRKNSAKIMPWVRLFKGVLILET